MPNTPPPNETPETPAAPAKAAAAPADALYLIDGSNFLFRAFHALPPMATKTGTPTGAVFGFTNMLLRLLDESHPSHLAVIFDAGGRSPRREIFAAYKANRPECPPELRPQFDLTRRVVRALGVTVLDARDVEADDLIATLARRAQAAGLPVVIVSSDKDLMQLCGAGVVLQDTMKDQNRGYTYGPAQVEEKFGVTPAQLGDLLALMGDSVDNVPGVPGVGPKTAAQLVKEFGSIEQILARCDEIKVRGADKVKAALREHAEQLRISRRLVALDEAVETPVTLPELRAQPLQGEELEAVLTELEFNRLLARLRPTPAGAAAPGAAAVPVTSAAAEERPALLRAAPRVILSEDELREVARALAAASEGFALALPLCQRGSTAHPATPRVTPLLGVALYVPGQAPVYVPLQHRYLGAPAQLGGGLVAQVLGPLFADAALRKRVYGLKDAQLALQQLGLGSAARPPLQGVDADPALCSYLLDPGLDHSLAALCERHLRPDAAAPKARAGQAARGPAGSRDLEGEEVSQVAQSVAAEAEAAYVLGGLLRAALPEPALLLLDQMEIPLAALLATIERHGVCLDSAVLHRLSGELAERLKALEADVAKAAGYEVNLGSPKQLAELLFEKLGLPPGKKTKTGYSTDAEVLEDLAAENPIARTIHEHRGLAKLKSTYVDLLPQLIDPRSGRLHTSYNQVVAATGRLSSTEPNLQNVPIRTELGRQIRRAFVAAPGFVLITADYSQIELRVLAHLSKDPLLVQSFLSGADVHERTAMEMFGAEEGRKPELRRVAKMINYGIVYGLTDYGLAVRLSIDRKVAKKYITEYFARYAGVKAYLDLLVANARREGGARTLQGRWRPLPDINTKIYTVRSYAERMAKNTPIQGTAADILKLAMLAVQARLVDEGEGGGASLGARMLLTVHDELVLEAPEASAQGVSKLLREAMEGAFKLDVPLQVDVGVGKNWADCD